MAFVAQQINMHVAHPTILDVTCDVTAKKCSRVPDWHPAGSGP